jgi:hypothetical protein
MCGQHVGLYIYTQVLVHCQVHTASPPLLPPAVFSSLVRSTCGLYLAHDLVSSFSKLSGQRKADNQAASGKDWISSAANDNGTIMVWHHPLAAHLCLSKMWRPPLTVGTAAQRARSSSMSRERRRCSERPVGIACRESGDISHCTGALCVVKVHTRHGDNQ